MYKGKAGMDSLYNLNKTNIWEQDHEEFSATEY